MKIFYQGGLGNQLFQYSFGKYLLASGYDIEFSTILLETRFKSVTKREFELDFLDQQISSKKIDLIKLSLTKKTLFNKSKLLIEMTPNNNLEKLIDKKTQYILGYFQSCKYITNIWDQEKFRLQKLIYKPTYLPENYISIHLRASDYRKNENKEIFGLLSTQYFEEILNTSSASKIKNIVVVTDSISEASEFVSKISRKDRNIQLLKGKTKEDLNVICHSDIALLSNSSFSWWGGYLGSKLFSTEVYAPKPWYVNNWETQEDFYPSEWFLRDRN